MEYDAAAENPGTPKRHRWPAGPWGTFRYCVDHLIFRFNAPVDWGGMRAIEESMVAGYPVFIGGFALLCEEELEVVKLLAHESDPSKINSMSGMAEDRLRRIIESLMQKLGATSFVELSRLASELVKL